MINCKDLLGYEDASISLRVVKSKRKTLAISIHPGKQLVVRAPYRASKAWILSHLLPKRQWIQEKLNYFPLPAVPVVKPYTSGAVHFFLGKPYQLVIHQGSQQGISIKEASIIINILDESLASVQALLQQWYCQKAQEIFTERLTICHKKFTSLCEPLPPLKIRKLKASWGSMSRKGVITLSLLLIQAPEICIDYVIFHELCHLKHFNHSPDFYKLLASVMPNWKCYKQQLNQLSYQGKMFY